jgi:preprotein translocase subunit SecE
VRRWQLTWIELEGKRREFFGFWNDCNREFLDVVWASGYDSSGLEFVN